MANDAPSLFGQRGSILTSSGAVTAPLSSAGLLGPDGRPLPPSDPLDKPWAVGDPLANAKPAMIANLVHREVPLVSEATDWTVPAVRAALASHVVGLFDAPSQLIDTMIFSDARVQSALLARTAILGRPMRIRPPRRLAKNRKAIQCAMRFEDAWNLMASESTLGELIRWSCTLGFEPAQILWNTAGPRWIPTLKTWNPRYTFFYYGSGGQGRLIAITLDGIAPIIPGNGKWLNFAPYGEYRGWMFGALRAIAPWVLARYYALRDSQRLSERNGLPWIIGKTPAGADQIEIQNFLTQLANLGQENIFQVPQYAEGLASYMVELLETKANSHEIFQFIIASCNQEITLAFLGQTLTTEVKEGSMAAARVHGDVMQVILESLARALARCIHRDLARPFALFNYGDPALAPIIEWDVSPPEDKLAMSAVAKNFAEMLFLLRRAGYQINNPKAVARSFGVRIGLADISHVDPLQGGGGGAASGGGSGADGLGAGPGVPEGDK
jgi:phage gp29-like protein